MPDAWDSEASGIAWQGFLDEAMALPDALMTAAAGSHSSNWVEYDQFAANTAIRFQHWANLQLRGICQLLRTGDSSPPAYGLVRGLIEVWAHLHWIYNDGNDATWECRSLRTALMLLEEGLNSMKGVDPQLLADAGVPDTKVVREEAVVHLKTLIKAKGCTPHAARKRSGAEASVREIAQRANLPWIIPMWRQSSLVLHPLSIEWVLHDLGDGRSALITPPLSQLAGRLDHALTAYSNGAAYFLALTDNQGVIGVFEEELSAFRSRPYFLEVMEGNADASLEHRLGGVA